MKDHVPHLIALAALVCVLATIVILTVIGQKLEGMAAIGLGAALGGIVTGITPAFAGRASNNVANMPNATTLNVSNEAPTQEKK